MNGDEARGAALRYEPGKRMWMTAAALAAGGAGLLTYWWIEGAATSGLPLRALLLGAACVVTVPVLLLRMGRTYELTSQELLVYSFDRERERFHLRDFRGATARGHALRLDFDGRKHSIKAPLDDTRQAFLVELKRRAELAGSPRRPAVERLDHRTLRAQLVALNFGDTCVACGRPPAGTANVLVRRGYDILVARDQQWVHVPVPVCDGHLRRALALRWAPVLLVPLAAMMTVALKVGFSDFTWDGAVIFGVVGSLMLYRLLQAAGLERALVWWVVGVRAGGASSDLTEATFTFRTAEMMTRVHAASTSPRGT